MTVNRVSVIVTTYNRPDALLRVLDGLVRQTRAADEIIIADDGSGPETKRRIRDFKIRSEAPIKHVWQKDLGFRAARIRNKAIRASTGDYLIILDGDCIPARHFIRDHCELAKPGFFFQGKRLLADKVLSDSLTFDAFEKLSCRLLWSKHVGNRHHLLPLAWLPPINSRRLSGVRSCNMGLYRCDMYAVNGFNEAFEGWGREDSELAVRLYNMGLRRRSHLFAARCLRGCWGCHK